MPFTKISACFSVKKSFPIVRYFNGILFVFTLLVFLKCVHYSTDFGTRMLVPAAMILLRLMLYEITLWANQQRRLFGTSRIRATRGASWLRLLGILPRSSAMAVNFCDLANKAWYINNCFLYYSHHLKFNIWYILVVFICVPKFGHYSVR